MPSIWNKMGKAAKSIAGESIDRIEGKLIPSSKIYALHPDEAHLGQEYYAKASEPPPSSAMPLKSATASWDAPQDPKCMQPFVYIGLKPVETPLRLPESKYVILRQHDLLNDDKIDSTVGRDKNVYWVVKAANHLMVSERAKEVAAKMVKDSQGAEKRGDEIRVTAEQEMGNSKKYMLSQVPKKMEDTVKATKETGFSDQARNPLKSPSVEDFFADEDDEVIDTLPRNPMLKNPSTLPDEKQASVNPLYDIPWSEPLIFFRRDNKELFICKSDGKLYPVIWKVRSVRTPQSAALEDGGDFKATKNVESKFTDVYGDLEEEAWQLVD